jgi:hypothetical protein
VKEQVKAIGPQAADGHGGSSNEPLAVIAAVLGGADVPYPGDAFPEFADRLLDLSALHGVEALLDASLPQDAVLASWPRALRDRLRKFTHSRAALELLLEREVRAILSRLADAQVDALLIKGTPLAYDLYPQPYLRTRGDTDLLVRESQRPQADQVLRDAGYRAGPAVGGDLASCERSYTKTDSLGAGHEVDLHWRLSNLQIYARSLTFDELRAVAVPVRGLGPAALSPCAVHALLIACMHRTSHLHAHYFVDGVPHLEANRLIWLYDIHLLARRLSSEEWAEFVDLATVKGLRAVCLDGLRATRHQLGTILPEDILARLDATGQPERSAGYLVTGRWRRWWVELGAVAGWRQRARLISQWLFPPADHMLQRYEARSRCLLPWLYLRRAVFRVVQRW